MNRVSPWYGSTHALPSESSQRRGGTDSIVARDRAQLPVNGQRGDRGEGDQPPVAAQRRQQPDAGDRADQVRAGVAQHRPLAQGEPGADQDRPGEDPQQLERREGPGAEAEPGAEQRQPLLRPPRPQVEQVEEVGGEDQQRHVGEVAPGLEPAPGDDVGGERQRPDRLDRPGREPALAQRPRMPAPAARRVGRLAPAQRVVEEAEEGDAEQVGDPAAQLGIEQVEVAAVVEEGERRQRHQRRRRQHRAEREGELARPR